jgi:hypothetical protein
MAQRNVPPNFKSFFESVTIDASGSLIVSTLSASYASSSGAGFPYIGNAEITGSLDISQNLIVKGNATFRNAIIISSSTLYDSGSTKFGDSPDDTHQFTGSMQVKGQANFSGSAQADILSALDQLTFPTSNVKMVPTNSFQGPGLSIQVFSSSSGTPRWEEIGYFAE